MTVGMRNVGYHDVAYRDDVAYPRRSFMLSVACVAHARFGCLRAVFREWMRWLSSFAWRLVFEEVVSLLVDAYLGTIGVVRVDAVWISEICQTGIDSAVVRHLFSFRLTVHNFLISIGRTFTFASNARVSPPQAGHNVEASASLFAKFWLLSCRK